MDLKFFILHLLFYSEVSLEQGWSGEMWCGDGFVVFEFKTFVRMLGSRRNGAVGIGQSGGVVQDYISRAKDRWRQSGVGAVGSGSRMGSQGAIGLKTKNPPLYE